MQDENGSSAGGSDPAAPMIGNVSSSGEMLKGENEIDMDMSEPGVYKCTVRIPLRRNIGGYSRMGPCVTINQGSKSQVVKELLIYTPVNR